MSISTDTHTRIPPRTLRTRLREAREWRGLDQADIAKELGIGRTTVSNYESGVTEPKMLVINAWAVVTDVEVDWLKTGIDPEETGPDNGSRLGESNSRPSHYNVTPLFGADHETPVAA